MHNTNIKFWKKKLSNHYILDDDGSITFLALFTLGIMSAILHQHLRMGLNLPGHHGLEWMTVLLFGRMLSRYRWAALVIAAGAASSYMGQTAIFPMANAFKPAIIYLLNGACLDLLFILMPRTIPVYIKGPILGGISFVIKPLLLIPVAILLDMNFGSFDKHGYLFPVYTHFAFGAIGGMCGILLANMVHKNRHTPGK